MRCNASHFLLANDISTQAPAHTLKLVALLSQASGSLGMVGGQQLDLQGKEKTLTLSEVETIHSLKTGALIKASVQLGAIAAGCKDKQALRHLEEFSTNIGLAFQLKDDILDMEFDTHAIGEKADAKKRLDVLHQQALQALSHLEQNTTQLEILTDLIVQRTH